MSERKQDKLHLIT